MKASYFRSPAELRRWLSRNRSSSSEILLGFFKTSSKKKGITYKEALDEALAVGWIDGVRKSVDDERWTIRFTPRKAKSKWSVVNVARMRELVKEGRVTEAGLAAFEQRDSARDREYAYERETVELSPAFAKRLRANEKARAFFEAQPPGYRKLATFWVMSAKKEETRERRIATLIEDSASGRRIAAYNVGRTRET